LPAMAGGGVAWCRPVGVAPVRAERSKRDPISEAA
jgi:hypothetical protein